MTRRPSDNIDCMLVIRVLFLRHAGEDDLLVGTCTHPIHYFFEALYNKRFGRRRGGSGQTERGGEMEGGVKHSIVEVNGINMHYAEKGEGPRPVLFLHGFPELWYSWRHQISGLAARGYRCIAPDLRGFGQTDAPPLHTSYTVFHIVGDLIALLDLLGLEKVITRM